jgi:hypothetical protein
MASVMDGNRVRVFGADVDIALGRAAGHGGDRHAFDQHERVSLQGHAVGVGAGVALVRIADHVFLRRLQRRHGFPFDAGRKGRAAAAAQAGIQHLLHHLGCGQSQRLAQTRITFVRLIVGQRQRVGHAHAGEGEPLLLAQVGNVFGQAQLQRVRAAGEERRVKQAVHVAGVHRPVGDAARGGGDFDHGLEPEQAARTVAHQFNLDAPCFRAAQRWPATSSAPAARAAESRGTKTLMLMAGSWPAPPGC